MFVKYYHYFGYPSDSGHGVVKQTFPPRVQTRYVTSLPIAVQTRHVASLPIPKNDNSSINYHYSDYRPDSGHGVIKRIFPPADFLYVAQLIRVIHNP
ncbi:hypothetical protein NIES3974_46640 [Calothrix sp. NIES-3974]|nr:hypothetical protein NIES3974_46640 [Calothrix sp. NIES-3974]